MTAIVHIPNRKDFTTHADNKNEFKNDIRLGLEKPNKQIPSKYFYDEIGCELYHQIMRHPDYYLSRCEMEILDFHKKRLSYMLGKHPFHLVDLAPGEGEKSIILIEQFLHDGLAFDYIPMDTSAKYLNKLLKYFNRQLSPLTIAPVHANYFSGLDWLLINSTQRNVVLFLDAKIGHFDLLTLEKFLKHLWNTLKKGDYILLGFDLKKDIDILLRAYQDDAGFTSQFNLNLLHRVNRELSANFNLEKFRYYASYNVYSSAMESYLISLEPQTVNIRDLEQSFIFDEIEPIHVEYAYKYSLAQIEHLATTHGFKLIQNFTDSQQYFVDSLWTVRK